MLLFKKVKFCIFLFKEITLSYFSGGNSILLFKVSTLPNQNAFSQHKKNVRLCVSAPLVK